MKPVAHWRRVLRHAWSLRLIALSIVLSGVEVAIPYLAGQTLVPAGTFAALAGLTTVAAAAARLVAQKPLSGAAE